MFQPISKDVTYITSSVIVWEHAQLWMINRPWLYIDRNGPWGHILSNTTPSNVEGCAISRIYAKSSHFNQYINWNISPFSELQRWRKRIQSPSSLWCHQWWHYGPQESVCNNYTHKLQHTTSGWLLPVLCRKQGWASGNCARFCDSFGHALCSNHVSYNPLLLLLEETR